jgi:hypothetical protein
MKGKGKEKMEEVGKETEGELKGEEKRVKREGKEKGRGEKGERCILHTLNCINTCFKAHIHHPYTHTHTHTHTHTQNRKNVCGQTPSHQPQSLS